jgi:uncharacterized repeat protein (TIGR01451 family)
MHVETSSAAKPMGCPWATRTLTLLAAAVALLAMPAAPAAGAGFSVGANLLDLSYAKGNETDPCIAINPVNPANMAVVAASDGANTGLFFSFTTNTGAAWTNSFIATNGSTNIHAIIPAGGAYAEPSAAFDAYGHLFVAYLPTNFLGVAIAVSTNGGLTFSNLALLAPLDVTDQPRLTAPPSGAAAGSVWVVYQDYTTAGTPLQVQGMVSTSNTLGTFGPPEIVPGSSDGGFADIAAGPLGQVVVAFQDNLGGNQPDPAFYPVANVFVSVETNAIADGSLTLNGFGPTSLVGSDAIGGVTYIAAAQTGIGVNAAPGLGWNYDINSTNYDDLYLIYTAVGPNFNAVIAFNSSSDYGTNAGSFDTNWNGEIYVDDDATNGVNGTFNDHFLPHMAVDPVSGIVACSWYDCRNDQGATSPGFTNVIKTNLFVTNAAGSFSVITNIYIAPTDFIYVNAYDNNTPAQGTNMTIILAADNIYDFSLTTAAISTNETDIDLGTNFIFAVVGDGTNGGTLELKLIVTNIITTAYSTGNAANVEAVMYETVSTNGGRTFANNQQLIPNSTSVTSPATGIASDVARSKSLTGWGHYTGMAAYNAHFFPAWADNSDAATTPTNNPDGPANFDIYLNIASAVPYANLTVFVTNSPNSIISQEEITYYVIVTNRGTTATKVTVTNIISTNVTLLPNTIVPALGGTYTIEQITSNQEEIVFVLPSLGNGAVVTNTFRVTAGFSSYATNYASVYSPLYNLNPTNLLATNQVVLINGEALALGMTASETNVLIGDTVITTVTVTNLGPATNGPVYVTNFFSSNWTNVSVLAQSQGGNQVIYATPSSGEIAIVDFGLLLSNQSVTAIFAAEAASGSSLASQTVFAASQDINTNQQGSTTNLSFFVNDESLAIQMTSSSANVDLGETVTFNIAVTNLGLSYSGLVTVSDIFSTNLGLFTAAQSQGSSAVGDDNVVFSLGTLGAGEVAFMTVTAVALSGPSSAESIATVSSTDFDTNMAGTVATSLVTINDEDLGIGLTASPLKPQVGQTVTFSESVTNFGLSTNGVVMVTNTFSTNFGSITVLQPAAGYTLKSRVLTFTNLGALSAGQVIPITITAIATGAGTGTDTAKVGSQAFDTNTPNNTAKATLTITQPYITNLVVTPLASSAFIVFDTSAAATTQVQYGLTTAYGSFASVNPASVTHHVILLTGLAAGSNYDFEVLAFVGTTTLASTGSFSTTTTLILNTPDAFYSGIWHQGSVAAGIYSNYYQYSPATNYIFPTASAVFAPTLPAAGLYNVSIWYPSDPSFTSNAQVSVTGGTNAFIRSVNQTVHGGTWLPLATNMYFASGTNGTVILYNNTGETNRYLVANAMMWVYDAAQDYPVDGTVPAWWANFYFGTNVNGYVNGAALGSNGYSMYQNYVLGANPTNADSGLSFAVTPVSTNEVSVAFWPCQGGRNYQLQATTDLSSSVWTTLTNLPTVTTNGAGLFTVTTTNSASSFYRLWAYIIP